MKKFIILLVTGDAGDDGDYNGSVIGSYEGTVEAESVESAMKMVGQMLEKDTEDTEFDVEYYFEKSYVLVNDCQFFFKEEKPFTL